jgi:hypothetical protein
MSAPQNKPKFTPGEYYLQMQMPGGQALVCADGPNGILELATVHCEAEYGPLPRQANANLFRAAPKMYEALCSVLDKSRTWEEIRIEVAAAIREAEEGV